MVRGGGEVGQWWQRTKIGAYDLRHTAVSLSVSAGANVLAVARMVGHKDPSVTLRIYADLFDSDLDQVATKLDAVRAKAIGEH